MAKNQPNKSEITTTASLGINIPKELAEEVTEADLTTEELATITPVLLDAGEKLVHIRVKTDTKIYVGNRWWHLTKATSKDGIHSVPKSVKDILHAQNALDPI